jgi:hypothetical protein
MRGNIVDVKRRIVVARADRLLQVIDGVLVVVVIVVEVGFESLGTSAAAPATSINQRFVGVDFVDGEAALDVAVGVDLVGKRFAFAFRTRRPEKDVDIKVLIRKSDNSQQRKEEEISI